MAAVGTALLGRVLGHSKAEKAFRPWCDSFEDFLIYGLFMIGVVLAPEEKITNRDKVDPNFNLWWVSTYNAMDLWMISLLLLFIALILFALERIFLEAFKAANKLEKCYNLLLMEKIPGMSEDEGREIGGDDFNRCGGHGAEVQLQAQRHLLLPGSRDIFLRVQTPFTWWRPSRPFMFFATFTTSSGCWPNTAASCPGSCQFTRCQSVPQSTGYQHWLS